MLKPCSMGRNARVLLLFVLCSRLCAHRSRPRVELASFARTGFARNNSRPRIHSRSESSQITCTHRTCSPVLGSFTRRRGWGHRSPFGCSNTYNIILSRQSVTHHSPLLGSDSLDKLCCTYMYLAHLSRS